MVPIDMSMEARMVLAKMSFIYEKEGGDRIRITRDEDVVKLINYAVDSINRELDKYLDAFVKLCTHAEIKEMVAQGANIYRGALVSEDEVLPTAQSQKTTVMYRGVAVPAPEGQESKSAAEAEAAKQKKPKRVYRGRVIEE
jgi:hypothetical protein